MPSSRSPRTLVTAGLIIGGILLVGAMAALSGFLKSPLASGLLLAATVVISLALGLLWWSRIDEAAREAHKWAWWWGGSSGMVIGLIPLLVFGTGPVDDWIPQSLSPAAGFAGGILTVIACQVLGYLIAWIWWWISKR